MGGIGLLLHLRSGIPGGKTYGICRASTNLQMELETSALPSAKGLPMLVYKATVIFLLYSVPFSWLSFAYIATLFFERKLRFLL